MPSSEALSKAAPKLYERLAFLVEYLRFHTADGSADWDRCLPLHDEVIAEAEAELAKAEKDTL